MTLSTLPQIRADKARRYLTLAGHIAQTLSKDPSTQVGALFLHPTEYTVLAMGYNGMPRGCDDTAPERLQRPLKYEYFEHAERNTIYNAARERFRGAMVAMNRMPDMNCVRALISVGVTRALIFYDRIDSREQIRIRLMMEAGITLHLFPTGTSISEKGLLLRETCKAMQSVLNECKAQNPKAVVEAIAFCLATDGNEILAKAEPIHESGQEGPARRIIFDQVRPLLEGSVAVVTLSPCPDCAKALIAVGVREVVCPPVPEHLEGRWGWNLGDTLKDHSIALQVVSN